MKNLLCNAVLAAMLLSGKKANLFESAFYRRSQNVGISLWQGALICW
ncbi:hypothetical protein [Bacillus atrophaeus]|nr:hypothetical protein [Bacillus atrophaeus]